RAGPSDADRVAHPARAADAGRADTHASTALRCRLGSRVRQPAAIPASPHHESPAKNRARSGVATNRGDGTRRRLPMRAAEVMNTPRRAAQVAALRARIKPSFRVTRVPAPARWLLWLA